MKYTIVLAGNYREFKNFLDKNGGTDGEYCYGDAHNIMGIEAKEVVEYGTFYERKDAHDLRELAKSRVR